jgi:DNA-binding transcriptional MerR regulator
MAGPNRSLAARRLKKSPSAFRTISEVSEELDVPQHVLRFWETKFAQVRPLKRGGGRRYYRPDDVRVLERIRELLYRDGYTIKGVQRLFREEGVGIEAEPAQASPRGASAGATAPAGGGAGASSPRPNAAKTTGPLSAGQRTAIEEAIRELVGLRDLLRRL